MSQSAHILMCPPDYYGIDYEINPWMDRRQACNRERAIEQWEGLRDLLESLNVKISYLTPVRGLPDLIFTANAAVICRDIAIPSQFRPPQRRGEQPHNERWFAEHGFRLVHLPSNFFFEGAGDALFAGKTLFAGYRIRSDAGGHQQIGVLLDCRVIPLELVDERFYHLDTCFCPIADDTAIVYLDAFDEYGQKVLKASIPNLITVNEVEAQQFACNAVVIQKEKTIITNTGCPQLHQQIKAQGFTPKETPLDEFLKSGGSAKCLTLRLDGEDAATWE